MTFEKKNHHYVPQFWQKGFRDANGRLFGLTGGSVKQVSTKCTMQGNWIYTVFDTRWNPSDSLENELSVLEGKTAALFRRIHSSLGANTADDRNELCSALALQACRHPDIMGRGHRRANELASLLERGNSLSSAVFINEMGTFYFEASEALEIYNKLSACSPAQLATELTELRGLSPQDSQLPEQEALLAKSIICVQLQKMEISLLDAPSGADFVLGDTPLPQENLSQGFSIPISKSVAVTATSTSGLQTTLARRTATEAEVRSINKWQFENALRVVIGPSRIVLEALKAN
jgi:hypothetical protein